MAAFTPGFLYIAQLVYNGRIVAEGLFGFWLKLALLTEAICIVLDSSNLLNYFMKRNWEDGIPKKKKKKTISI